MENFQQADRLLIDKLRVLFNSEKFSDFQFKIGGDVVYAHRLVLMLGSPVFEIRFNDKTDTSDLQLIEEVKYEVFLEFIRFFYTESCTINKENVFELLKLAQTYKNYKLEETLVNFLVNIPRSDDPQKLGLLQTCLDAKYLFLVNRFKWDICTELGKFLSYRPEICDLKRDTLTLLLQVNYIDRDANEFKIFEMLMAWIKHSNSELSSIDLLKLIRFTTMNMDEFSKCIVMQGNILKAEDIGNIVKCIISPDEPCNEFNKVARIVLDKSEMEWTKIPENRVHTIKFTVTEKLLIRGLWITKTSNRQRCVIVLKNNTNEVIRESVINTFIDHDVFVPVLFREPIETTPNMEYTIDVTYETVNQDYLAIKNNTVAPAQHGDYIKITTAFDCLYYIDFTVSA